VRVRKLRAFALAKLLPAGALKASGSDGVSSTNPRPAASTRHSYSGPAHVWNQARCCVLTLYATYS